MYTALADGFCELIGGDGLQRLAVRKNGQNYSARNPDLGWCCGERGTLVHQRARFTLSTVIDTQGESCRQEISRHCRPHLPEPDEANWFSHKTPPFRVLEPAL